MIFGIEECENIAYRQIPTNKKIWDFSSWSSENGEVRNRYFDIMKKEWKWDEIRKYIELNGVLGLYIYGEFLPIERIIASAWCEQKRPSKRLPKILHNGSKLIAYNLEFEEDDEEEEEEEEDQIFLPIRCKFGLIKFEDPDFEISEKGFVRTKYGIFRGNYHKDVRMFSLPNVGLIPVNELADLIFQNKRTSKVPPRIKKTMHLLRDKFSIKEIAIELKIQQSTAWSYVFEALQHFSTKSATKLIKNLIIFKELIPTIEKLPKETILSGNLSKVMELLDDIFSDNEHWKNNKLKYAEVRALRFTMKRNI